MAQPPPATLPSPSLLQQYEIQAGSDCEEPPILLEKESGGDTEVTGARALDEIVSRTAMDSICTSKPVACAFVLPCTHHPGGNPHGRPMFACDLQLHGEWFRKSASSCFCNAHAGLYMRFPDSAVCQVGLQQY